MVNYPADGDDVTVAKFDLPSDQSVSNGQTIAVSKTELRVIEAALPISLPSITELAEVYVRARVEARRAKTAVENAHSALFDAEVALRNAEDRERESLELLDLAVACEVER